MKPDRWIQLFTGMGLVGMVAATLFFGLRSSPSLSEIGWLPDFIGNWADSNWAIRTAVPFLFLGFLWQFLGGRTEWLFGGHVFLVGLGIAIELIQFALPDRFPDWKDVFWSTFGVACGALTASFAQWAFRNTRSARQ